MDVALKNLMRVCIGAVVIGLLSACGGGNDPTGNASPSSVANISTTNLPSFLPTTDMPPSARTLAIQLEGGRLNSEELAQTAKTGVLPKPFDGPLLSGAEDLSRSIGNNSSAVAPSFPPQISAHLTPVLLTQAYRFYNPRTTAHFFTTNTAERANIIANLPFMNDEGPSFFTSNAVVAGLSPVHRFYNTQTGVHFFTISEGERAKVAADLPQYNYEGIAYYASQLAGTGLTPLYRFYYASKGFHFFTSNIAERDNIIATLPNYRYEGVGYYVMNSAWQATDVPGTNATPVANAGGAQNVLVGNVVTLNGRGSSDANGDTLTYMWTGSGPPGSSATLIGANTVAPTFTADVAGTYVISLVVRDGKASSVPATVTITASAPLPAAVTLYLYSGEATPVYLGCLTCSQFNVESVCNKFGTYGSEFQSRSIWNQFGTYGSRFNTYSAWNQFSSNGPAIIGSDNLFYGYFTVNNFRSSRTTIQSYVNILNFYSSTNNLASTRAYTCGN